MDLELPLQVHRSRQPVQAEVVRELVPADLERLGDDRETSAPASQVTRIRDRHHALARCIAAGMTNIQASQVTGYAPETVSQLQASPAFEELVAHYQADINLAMGSLHDRLSVISLEAANIIQDRLETAPDDVSFGQLLETVKVSADRTGFGPKQTQVNINVDLEARLEAARKRAGLIDITPEAKNGP